jgi:hypothetical protein
MMASAFAAPTNKATTNGKKGEITLVQPVKVGTLVLQPGTYLVQYRTSGEKHFLRFTKLKRDPIYWYWAHSKAGDVVCGVEPAAKVAAETSFSTVSDHDALRITDITIKGERVVYHF